MNPSSTSVTPKVVLMSCSTRPMATVSALLNAAMSASRTIKYVP